MTTSTDTVSFFLAMAVVATAVLQAMSASPPPPTPIPQGMPADCASTFFKLYDCIPFLTFGTVISGPPANCCAPLREVLGTPASICLCHAIGSEINALLNTNIDPIRLALLPLACWAIVPPQLPAMCILGPVPPMSNIPLMPPSPAVTPTPPTPPVTPPSPPMRPLP